MKLNEAVGKRHLIVTSAEPESFKELALILQEEFEPKNYKILYNFFTL